MQQMDVRGPRMHRPDFRTRILHVLENPPATVIWLTLTAATVIALKAIGL